MDSSKTILKNCKHQKSTPVTRYSPVNFACTSQLGEKASWQKNDLNKSQKCCSFYMFAKYVDHAYFFSITVQWTSYSKEPTHFNSLVCLLHARLTNCVWNMHCHPIIWICLDLGLWLQMRFRHSANQNVRTIITYFLKNCSYSDWMRNWCGKSWILSMSQTLIHVLVWFSQLIKSCEIVKLSSEITAHDF